MNPVDQQLWEKENSAEFWFPTIPTEVFRLGCSSVENGPAGFPGFSFYCMLVTPSLPFVFLTTSLCLLRWDLRNFSVCLLDKQHQAGSHPGRVLSCSCCVWLLTQVVILCLNAFTEAEGTSTASCFKLRPLFCRKLYVTVTAIKCELSPLLPHINNWKMFCF